MQTSPFITIMVDETTDSSNQEQATMVIRWVSDSLQVSEEFVGLYQVPAINADTLTSAIKDVLLRMNLAMARIRGQCYDGASSMRGARTGVAKQIKDAEARALYTHCYGHSLNLAVGDAIKASKLMSSALDTTYEIVKLVKYSPKRELLFKELKKECGTNHGDSVTPGVRALCPTRWTVRADSLSAIVLNYSTLQSTWDNALEVARDSESKARIHGVSSQMKTFEYYFGISLGELVLRHSDNLSRTLQHKSLSAAEGQHVAAMVVKTIESMRSEEAYKLFWDKVLLSIESLDVEQPQLPRRRKVPKRFDDSLAAPEFHDSPMLYFRQHYYEAIDLIVSCISD